MKYSVSYFSSKSVAATFRFRNPPFDQKVELFALKLSSRTKFKSIKIKKESLISYFHDEDVDGSILTFKCVIQTM
jgi:hypothetical protein